jgi:hypothetical protein
MPRKTKHSALLKVSLAVGVILLAALLISTESLVVPTWSVEVIDINGKPIEGINVRQVWQDYSVELQSHEEVIVTGKNGKASFPERKVAASTLARILGPIGNVLNTGVHASFGPSSWLIVWGKDDLEGGEIYLVGKPLPERVTVKRRL